ncbi:hypothetical protein [Pseudomonas sp. BP01]|uniref:hypothetical protein n=1 Tax=Pseudomonas sp. BP01 TaxID=2976152 RepID=UPI001FAA4009|nr:hypothetical protein [Pseudomonas sp. BP01]
MKTSVTPKAIDTTTAEQTAIQLRKTGATYAQIREATGLTERQVKKIVKGITKEKRPRSATSRAELPFTKSVERVLPLATRSQGIRDYELRSILHEEYGCTWNTSTGKYESNHTPSHIKRVKQKVREQASDLGCNALFLPDWIDDCHPRASSEYLIAAATDLWSRVDEYVNEYMALHGTSQDTDYQHYMLTRRKQYYAVRQHLLKLAIPNYGDEPVEKLLHRTAALVGELDGNSDTPVSECTHDTGARASPRKPEYHPEPSPRDVFLDFIQAQGWIKA